MSLILIPLMIAQYTIMLFATLYAWDQYGLAGGAFGLLASAAVTMVPIGYFQHRIVNLVVRDA